MWYNTRGFTYEELLFVAGSSVNMEGAVPTEQEINQPKPSKRARTSFTADQLQVNPHHRK